MSKGYDFIHLNLEPLVVSIQSNARSWVKSIGKLLNQAAKENLNNLKGELEVILRFTLWVLLFITCLKCSIKVSVMEFLAKIVKLWFSDDFKGGGRGGGRSYLFTQSCLILEMKFGHDSLMSWTCPKLKIKTPELGQVTCSSCLCCLFWTQFKMFI